MLFAGRWGKCLCGGKIWFGGVFSLAHGRLAARAQSHTAPCPPGWGSWPPPRRRHGALLPPGPGLPGTPALPLGLAVPVLPYERRSEPGFGQGRSGWR